MHSRPQKTLFTNQSHKNSLNFVYNGDCKAPHDYNWTIQALYQLHVLLIIKMLNFFMLAPVTTMSGCNALIAPKIRRADCFAGGRDDETSDSARTARRRL